MYSPGFDFINKLLRDVQLLIRDISECITLYT